MALARAGCRRHFMIEPRPDGRWYDRLADGPDEFHGHCDVVSGFLGSSSELGTAPPLI